jgi:hypothetical protein
MRGKLIAILAAVLVAGCGGGGLSADAAYEKSCSEIKNKDTEDQVAEALVGEVDAAGSHDQIKGELKGYMFTTCLNDPEASPGKAAVEAVGR